MPRTRNNFTAADIAVLQTQIAEIASDLSELKTDVKRLLAFRAFVWGGATALGGFASLIVSLILRAIER